MKFKVKSGDNVKVISGKDKGKCGQILSVDAKSRKVKVQGVALCVKHYKARKNDEKSGMRVQESFIDISNVKKC
jgi:large subunit ribosomal protein L24